MLRHLSIKNYALIDQLEISFSDGLTIITGETGAGKSILLGALSLVTGKRADTGALQDKNVKCIVEATFRIKETSLSSFFKLNELDFAEDTLVRREISPDGKSRAFINDTPVNLTILKEFAEQLIDIHSQHETFTLNDSAFQLELLDVFAGQKQDAEGYLEAYKTFRDQQQLLTELLEKESQFKKDQDYFNFQFAELEEAQLKPGEQTALEQELQLLSNAEEIKKNLSRSHFLLDGGENNLLSTLSEVKTAVAGMARYNSSIRELLDRITSAYIELKDVSNEMESVEQQVQYNPKRIEEVNLRLDTMSRLQNKHQVKQIEELLEIRDRLELKLKDISSLEGEIERRKKELSLKEKSLRGKAGQLSKNRTAAIPKIEKEIRKTLADLGMPNAELSIQQQLLDSNRFNSTGIDKVSYLFRANKGGDLKELQKVASGGELSRLMLSLKALIAQLTSLPAILFDEIDTGVSGEVANKVGLILYKMAQSMQVITITHLPQIASKGSNHLFVFKEEKNKKTYSRIKNLNAEERVVEIAKMLSTQNPTDAALKNAKELLKS